MAFMLANMGLGQAEQHYTLYICLYSTEQLITSLARVVVKQNMMYRQPPSVEVPPELKIDRNSKAEIIARI